MATKCCLSCIAALALVTIAGCPSLFEDPPALILVGAANDKAYLEHYAEWSGFVTNPSTLWELDADSGAAASLQDATTQYDVQVDGDYYVAERPTADNKGSEVVAVEIASGDMITVLERDVVLGGRYDREFVLTDGRVVARTDDGLIVYDLDARAVLRTIPVDDPIAEIETADGDWALVTLNEVFSDDELLVNLATGATVAVPALPDNANGYYYGAVIAGNDLILSSFVPTAQSVTDNAVQILHIPTLTWQTLAEYDGSGDDAFTPEAVYTVGADETHVVAMPFKSFAGCWLEVIDRESGERTRIAQTLGFFATPYCVSFDNGVVYWTDDSETELVRYDVATGTQHTVSLEDVAP